MTGPEYPLVQVLPTIPVTCYAGQPLTITVPVLAPGGGGADVDALAHARAQIRTSWDSDNVLHAWDDTLTNAVLDGTPGGTDAVVVLTASGTETALWQQQWPRLDVEWDLEVETLTGDIWRLCAVSTFLLLPEITRYEGT